MMKGLSLFLEFAFEYPWNICEAPPMSCPVFRPTIIFHPMKKWCIFLFMLFHTHRILVIFHDHVVKSE